MDIADMITDFATGDPEGKLGYIGSLNPVGKWYSGIVQGTKTLGTGIKEFAEASQEGDIDKLNHLY